jgi:hypothetical protein
VNPGPSELFQSNNRGTSSKQFFTKRATLNAVSKTLPNDALTKALDNKKKQMKQDDLKVKHLLLGK